MIQNGIDYQKNRLSPLNLGTGKDKILLADTLNGIWSEHGVENAQKHLCAPLMGIEAQVAF